MTSVTKRVIDTYNYVIYDLSDPRVKDVYLLSNPLIIISITSLYLYFCTTSGPRYMKDRKPYDLKNVIILYNMVQVVISTWITVEGVRYMMSEKFNLLCAPVDYSDDPLAVRVMKVGHSYFYLKLMEFLDTIFFVLRKKNEQISLLHVYHHSMMAFTMWIGARYFSGGHGTMMMTLNSFVHIIMYAYYLISGLGPQYQKYLWWKKHVTVLQLVQFVIIFFHNTYPLFTDCSYPKWVHCIKIANAVIFINLFGRFFYASYVKPKKNGLSNRTQTHNGEQKYKHIQNGVQMDRIIQNSDQNGKQIQDGGPNDINGHSSILADEKLKHN